MTQMKQTLSSFKHTLNPSRGNRVLHRTHGVHYSGIAVRPSVTLLAAAIALAWGHPVAGQSSSDITALSPVVVTANPLGRDTDSMVTPATVLQGDALIERRGGTLGELLDGQAGVHADPFGGGASRPVLRGQTAPRVKVLNNGAEVMDASSVSPDHVVTVDTYQAHTVEILRGPSALLYGGSAIGGVVNVLDDKIPTALPEGGFEGSVEVLGSTAAKSRAGALGLTVGEGNLALRVQAGKRRADNYRVPHWTASRVENSQAETGTASLGLSFVGDRGYLGASHAYREDDYGLPGHSHAFEECHPHGSTLHCDAHDHDGGHDDDDHGHDHDHDAEHHAVSAKLRSHRLDMRGELHNPFAGFETLRMRAGYTDYRHDEREGDEIGTAFFNRGFDARMELVHQAWHGWKGVAGVQLARYDFGSRGGDEDFIVKTRTHSTGLFVLEEYQWRNWRFELGARHEWQSVKPDRSDPAEVRPAVDGTATSVSAGTVWNFTPAYAASLSLSRAQRLPGAQEYYARGLHLATNTFEQGDVRLKRETSHSIDLGLRKTAGDARFNVNLFHSRVKGYIYGRTLDTFEDDGNVFRLIRYTQQDAQFTGLEADVSYRVIPQLSLSVFGDVVHGKLRGNAGNLPRIPAARVGVRSNVTWQQWRGFVEYTQVLRQNRVALAEKEQKTAGYGMLGLGVAYHMDVGASHAQFYVRASNLLNKLAYNHVSFVSRAAPLQGRSVHAGIRVEF